MGRHETFDTGTPLTAALRQGAGFTTLLLSAERRGAGDYRADEAEALALVEAIEEAWGHLTALERGGGNGPELTAAVCRRDELIDAADALPARSRAARYAKALALAWISYADLWEAGRPHGDYATDGRLALAIDASFSGDEGSSS